MPETLYVRAQVLKFSPEWGEFGIWRNWYLLAWGTDDASMRDVAERLTAFESAIHQEHVNFLCVITNPVVEIFAEPWGNDGEEDANATNDSRFWAVPNEHATGGIPSDADPDFNLGLHVVKPVPRGRRGHCFYRGVMQRADCDYFDTNGVTCFNMGTYQDRLDNAFLTAGFLDSTVFHVQHGGAQLAAWGFSEPSQPWRVKNVNRLNGTTRARSRIPAFRRGIAETLYTNALIGRQAYDNMKYWQGLGTDFNPVTLQDDARRVMERSLAISGGARKHVESDDDNQCISDSPLDTRFGPTSGEVITLSGLAVQNHCEAIEPTEHYNQKLKDLNDLQPDVVHPSGTFYSQTRLAEMLEIIEEFWHPAQALTRIDVLISTANLHKK